MADRKRDFLNWLGRDLDAIDAQLDEFRAEHGDLSPGDGKTQPDERMRILLRRRDEIRRRSRDLEEFDGSDWDEMRHRIERERDELKASLARVRERRD